LDLYSVNKSIDLVISYLDKIDKSAANKARERYGCFNKFKEELSKYGYATVLGITPSCENAVIEQLLECIIHNPSKFIGIYF
jgi:erythromycin esterase-like protein